MGLSGGIFWGYRELDVAKHLKRTLKLPSRSIPPPQTNILEVERLSTPTYDYRVFSGDAEDDYPDDLVQVGFLSRMVIISIKNSPLEIEYSYDGETILDTQILRHSHRAVRAVRAFRVRNVVPGWTSWYQVFLGK